MGRGASGTHVCAIQTALNAVPSGAYAVPVDGDYSAEMEAAVGRFQDNHGMTPTQVEQSTAYGGLTGCQRTITRLASTRGRVCAATLSAVAAALSTVTVEVTV